MPRTIFLAATHNARYNATRTLGGHTTTSQPNRARSMDHGDGDYLASAFRRGRGRPPHDSITIGADGAPDMLMISSPLAWSGSLRHARVGDPLVLTFSDGTALSVILGPHGPEIRQLHPGKSKITWAGGSGKPSKPAESAFLKGAFAWVHVGGDFVRRLPTD